MHLFSMVTEAMLEHRTNTFYGCHGMTSLAKPYTLHDTVHGHVLLLPGAADASVLKSLIPTKDHEQLVKTIDLLEKLVLRSCHQFSISTQPLIGGFSNPTPSSFPPLHDGSIEYCTLHFTGRTEYGRTESILEQREQREYGRTDRTGRTESTWENKESTGLGEQRVHVV